ncbi:MAG TPA: YaeQ family protein [Polyangiaceae bacterium]|nr:YaeQ family protein [Polyangiaceae bacterium]
MAKTATVYRLTVELSDIDRGLYETLDFRVAQHPSEGLDRVVARILSYALLHEEYLEFGRGISDGDEPDLWSHDLTGRLLHWIDVGTPSADRIHAASKKASNVSIVCHKRPDALAREMAGRRVHNAEAITVLYLEPTFVERLANVLDRTSSWTIVYTDGELNVTVGSESFATSVARASLSSIIAT